MAQSCCAWGKGPGWKAEGESRDGAGAVPGSPRHPVPSSFSVPGSGLTSQVTRDTSLLWRQPQTLSALLGKLRAAWTPS